MDRSARTNSAEPDQKAFRILFVTLNFQNDKEYPGRKYSCLLYCRISNMTNITNV